MNNKDMAQQLFETKFIKALYQTNLDRSLLNRIIAEELIRETEDSTVDGDQILDTLNTSLQQISDEKGDPVKNLIELFKITAKFKASYLPKYIELAKANEEGFDGPTALKLDRYLKAVGNVIEQLAGPSVFSIQTFIDNVENEVPIPNEVVDQIKKTNEEKLEQLYEKLSKTALKVFNDAISKIKNQEKSGEITDKSSAISEIRKIVSQAQTSLERLEGFPKKVKQKLGNKYEKYGKLKSFVENKIPEVVTRIKQFLSNIADKKDQIQSDLANLRSLKEDMAAEIPESIKDIVSEWKTLEEEISEVFDAMTDKKLYTKGAVDDEGDETLPPVTLEDGSLAEMLAFAMVYEKSFLAKDIFNAVQSSGVGIRKSIGSAFKKAFNEEENKEEEGRSPEEKLEFQKAEELFRKFEAEIALAFAVRILEGDGENEEVLRDYFDSEENFESGKLNFRKSDLADNPTAIKILKQFKKNKRQIQGVQYDIERKLRKGEWNTEVFESLLSIVSYTKVSVGYRKPLQKFLQQIYMVDGYDPKMEKSLDTKAGGLKQRAIDAVINAAVAKDYYSSLKLDPEKAEQIYAKMLNEYKIFDYNTFNMLALQALMKRKPKPLQEKKQKVASVEQIKEIIENPELFAELEGINILVGNKISQYIIKKYPHVDFKKLIDSMRKRAQSQIDMLRKQNQRRIRSIVRDENLDIIKTDLEKYEKELTAFLTNFYRIKQRAQDKEDEKRQEDWIEDNPFLPKDTESEITRSGKKQEKNRKDRKEKEAEKKRRKDRARAKEIGRQQRLGESLEESIEKLIYLMLNEYKQKMEP